MKKYEVKFQGKQITGIYVWLDDDQALSRKMVKDAVGGSYNGFQLRVELVEIPIETSKTFNLRKKNWGKFYKTHFPWTLLYVVLSIKCKKQVLVKQ